ncbi:MAG: photosynthetic reaction center cytochrome c subunit [Sphingomonas sp.]|nr:photosynthetic reaction center cytochrome c subunit [Sphingomonas sp.]
MSGSSNILRLAVIGGAALTLAGCEIGHKKLEQTGFRGTGGDQIIAASRLVAQPVPAPPFALPADGGPTAGETYQNVQVLKGVSAERFNYLMASMNNWVAPQTGDPAKVGCNYCHNPENMASDEKYTKVVARRMLQMTQNINANWSTHVKGTGVTCWTCHRGNAVPQYKWAIAPDPGGRVMGNKHGQNTPAATVAFASLPYDPFTPYIKGAQTVRVQGTVPLPTGKPGASIAHTEQTYALMMHMSSALNVNCTFCHNTDSFSSWSNSRPQRVGAWYGIRMVRQANDQYINPLASVFPAYRKGPHGDPYKVNCSTCHQGLNKPLGGVSMLADYPMLVGAAGGSVAASPVKTLVADPNATAKSCNADFDKALAGKTIQFDTGAATVQPVSTPLLDTLTEIAGRCSNFKMLVEGHTDAVGDAAKNLTLSDSRAAAVEQYFVGKGVKADQIAAKGFGSTKPLDTSGTPAGNQRNRRIEISVAAK